MNEEQKRAVDTIDGPVLVVAGPGSGKTELLALRVARILQETDTPPSGILCLTFTDSAALNMQKRLAGLIGAEAYKVHISTFHAFGKEIINRYPDYFYKGVTYKALDELMALEILEQVLDSLPHDNPLASYSDDHGYAFLKDIRGRIGDLKKGGLGPDEFEKIVNANEAWLKEASKILDDFLQNHTFRGKQIISAFPAFIEELKAIPGDGQILSGYQSIKEVLMEGLELAYGEALEINKTNPLTSWKGKVAEKNGTGRWIFKALADSKKTLALAEIYRKYQEELQKQGYFDFDDMIMDVCAAVEKRADLKFNLQEQYQYVLVDEFQDSNGVQMRLLMQLLDAEVNEGRPNVLAVGDDDQAIYKFQGAKLDNIMGFTERFRDPAKIVLTKNYRSTQPVLNLLRKVILQGEDRLENRMEDIVKELEAANKQMEAGEITEKTFQTEFVEFSWITEDVQRRLKAGEDAREIAIIGRQHKSLEEIARYLDYRAVPIAYERKKNIFGQKHIMELITMLRFIDSLNKSGQAEADDLLPEILAYEFFGISRMTIWKISLAAYGNKGHGSQKFWLEVMMEHEDEKIRRIAEFLVVAAGFATEWTGEEMIDRLTGVKAMTLEDGSEYVCPYKEFYFGKDVFEGARHQFMDHLKALQAFVARVRDFRGGMETLKVAQLIEFVESHERKQLNLFYETAFNNSESAVQVMTAHRAKGLEFETVYVIGCNEEVWFSKGRGDNLKFPPNVPLSAEADDADDKLRLFYVSLSRAKRNLCLCHHKYKDDGKELRRLRFLVNKDVEANLQQEVVESTEERAREFYEMKFNPVKHEHHDDRENALLKKLLENYQLSATHLNNFLDISNAGPQFFLEKNLLRFPQKQSVSLAFGNAVHESMEKFHREFAEKAVLPSLDYLLKTFELLLGWKRLTAKDFKKTLERGRKVLQVYYEQRKDSFDKGDWIELNFKGQNVIVDGARLTGKLDKVKVLGGAEAAGGVKELQVFDLKTGKNLKRWDSSLKARKYKDQLIFYKLLIENSRDYSKYCVNEGVIEFVEPNSEGEIVLLPHYISEADVAEMKKLVKVIYGKIMNLDFPDVSAYPLDGEGKVTKDGVKLFRADLVAGLV